MVAVSLKAALRHPLISLAHMWWLPAYLSGGTTAIYRLSVSESTDQLERHSVPAQIGEVAETKPVSTLGKLGATQDYLYWAVRVIRPSVIVETGVFRGISSAFILAALAQNEEGHLVSIDLPEARYRTEDGREDSSELPKGVETGFAVPDRLRKRWTLIKGDSRVELPQLLDRLGTIDMFYHDSEHTYTMMSWEYNLALKFLRPGGVLVSDDVGWNSAFAEMRNGPRVRQSWTVRDKLGLVVLR